MGLFPPPLGARGSEPGAGPLAAAGGTAEAGGRTGEGVRRAGRRGCGVRGPGSRAGVENGRREVGRGKPASREPEPGTSDPDLGARRSAAWTGALDGGPPPGSESSGGKLCLKFGAAAAGPPGVGAALSCRPGAAAGSGGRGSAAPRAVAGTQLQSRGVRPAPCLAAAPVGRGR